MPLVRITINGTDAEYTDVTKLPILFNKQIDKWQSYVGAFGTSADNTTPNLSIPYTKKNAAIAGNSGIVSLDNHLQRRPLSINISLDGSTFFAGNALLKQTILGNGGGGETLQWELKGDNLDLFSQLDNTSLRSLNLGIEPTTEADITATWVGVSSTSNTILWLPVAYGGVTTDVVSIKVSIYQYYNGLRPSVRIWKIIEAIFAVKLGYTIISNLYESEQFKNEMYCFGVGDLWKRADNFAIYKNYIGMLADQLTVPSNTFVNFDNEAGQFSDPQGMNNTTGVTYFDAQVAGGDAWYQFSINVNSDCDTIELLGVDIHNAVIGAAYIIATFAANTRGITDPILFCPDRGLTRLFFRVVTTNPVCSIFKENSYYQAQMLDRFAYGADLDVASCLHDRQVKDFLRGIQHQFNLVFYSDSISKTVWFDPRFAIPNDQYVRIPQGIYKPFDAYYDVTEEPKNLLIDTNKWYIENRRTFGNWLKLGYAADTSDGLLNYYNDQIKPVGAQDLHGAQFNFNETGRDGQSNLNPYFTPLLNIQLSNFASGTGNVFSTIYPCIIEDIQDVINDYTRIPSYESAPKIAQYYGVLDFTGYFNPIGSPQYPFLYFSEAANGLPQANTVLLIPSMFQVFPDWEDYWDVLGGIPFNLSYGDLQYTNASALVPAEPVFGLITFYIEKYLRIMNNDKWLIGQFLYRLNQFYADDFRKPINVTTPYGVNRYWQVQIYQFAPLESDTTQVLLVADADTSEGEHSDLVSNEEVYMFILDQQVLVNR